VRQKEPGNKKKQQKTIKIITQNEEGSSHCLTAACPLMGQEFLFWLQDLYVFRVPNAYENHEKGYIFLISRFCIDFSFISYKKTCFF